MRLLNSSNSLQSNEVRDCVPQPNTWHAAWELLLNISQCPLPPIPSSSPSVSLRSLYNPAFFQKSDILTPHHLSVFWSGEEAGGTYGIYIILIYYSSPDLIHACCTSFPTQQKSMVCLHFGSARWCHDVMC